MYFQEQELHFFFKGYISKFTEREQELDQLSPVLNLFPEEKTEASSERKMILRWPSEVLVSECFGFRENVAKGLSRVWSNARNAGIRNPETTVLALFLSSGTCSLSLCTPAPLPESSLQASSTGRSSVLLTLLSCPDN